MMIRYLKITHLEVSAEADDALHVCTVVTQNILSTQQRDLVLIHRYLQPKPA